MTDISDGLVRIIDPVSKKQRIELVGNHPTTDRISIGGNGKACLFALYPSEDTLIAPKQTAGVYMHGGGGGIIDLGWRRNASGKFQPTVHLSGNGNLYLGGSGVDGDLVIQPTTATDIEDATQQIIRLNGGNGSIVLNDTVGKHSCTLNSYTSDDNRNLAGLWIGASSNEGSNKAGTIVARDLGGKDSIFLNGRKSAIWLGAPNNSGDIVLFSGNASNFRDVNQATVWIQGGQGDIVLRNADCAEEFDVSRPTTTTIDPGTVMVIDDDGKLQKSSKAYDKRVAGVVSGAGDCKPGIILDKKTRSSESGKKRVPVALVGKVYCKVNAEYSQIKVGDLLTTSRTPGHAMKVTNRSKAFGAVIGKALRSLKSGKAMIPILIALQ